MDVLTVARDFLLSNDEDVNFYETLDYLNKSGYTLNEYEVDEVFKLVNDVALEISMVRSLHSWWMVKQHNKLCYGI